MHPHLIAQPGEDGTVFRGSIWGRGPVWIPRENQIRPHARSHPQKKNLPLYKCLMQEGRESTPVPPRGGTLRGEGSSRESSGDRVFLAALSAIGLLLQRCSSSSVTRNPFTRRS